MSTITQRFVLVGPHKGKSLILNGSHEFADGVYDFQGSHEQVSTLTRIFSFYGAMPEQEAELEALRAQAQSQASAAPIPQPTNLVEAVKQADPAEVETARQAAEAPVGGSPDAAAKLTLAESIGALDPEVDAHWTSNNLPSLEHLSELMGKKVARGDVDAVADGYTRAKARAARA